MIEFTWLVVKWLFVVVFWISVGISAPGVAGWVLIFFHDALKASKGS